MQNSVILAAAEGMPKYDRSAIMAHAWKLYRRDWANARPANAQARRKSFSRCLKSAWMTAKWKVAEVLKTIQQRAADRVLELTTELMRVDARPWRMRTTADRADILNQIATVKRSA
ncbi:hypothetical protein B5K08_22520 [Rhizobium leguminosarum bv. trifolii]|uniref:Uncharacterized protein n=1 Tax=Rhizobium leguminosarum bv. trifolii TaxID=386 RepID=A0A3E1B864_RHILT|nr:hypothetical protein [Rhizobium leguminosarum]RFB87221.1 hypothetical protein B5K08_22520 [Rhizobium leguminosarum bv. trifolii]RFB87402.1 hypothetical protein B5K10_22510 [Rhizobium leguminosarum bv. trifolii]